MSSPAEDEPETGVWTTDLSSFSADMVAAMLDRNQKKNLTYPYGEVVGNW